MKLLRLGLFLALLSLSVLLTLSAQAGGANPRIFVLVVCDGLRPDFVTQRDMPNLYRLMHQGVRFERHHAQYPTVTMVNAATLGAGATAGTTGILGDAMDLGPALAEKGVNLTQPPFNIFGKGPVNLEDTPTLEVANSSGGFGGYLVGLDTVAQEVGREKGFIAIVGKRGPTYLFDTRVNTINNGRDSLQVPRADYMFLSDDAAFPATLEETRKSLPPMKRDGVVYGARDAAFARFVADRALPAAKKAIDSGHPALVVLWLHNPDITEHLAGLGTLSAMQALTDADQDLGTVQAAVSALGLEDRTDLMVVSDHGFATIRLRVRLAALLVKAGLKKALESDDVIVAPNGGSDLVYLSQQAFPSRDARRERLQKIVDFCEAQEWCGPIFSRELALVAPAPVGRHHRRRHVEPPYKGWIDGTFAQSAVGLLSQSRSPDLIISFAESSNSDNKGLTGPNNSAFMIGIKGQQSVPNKSQPLAHPVRGVIYADLGGNETFTTGMGMHGAAGSCEIHNFAAVIGPDFKHGFADQNPSGNADVAPTIARVLGLLPNVGPGSITPSGRVMTEALRGERSYAGTAHPISMKTELELQGVKAITTLRLTRLGDEVYLDDSSVQRDPLGSSP
jgi:arylsulfatase A-like enzyme